MVIRDKVVFTEKQKKAAKFLADVKKKFVMFYGSSRSGKTFLVCYFIRHRARKYEGSKHLVARYSFANAKKTIWLQTLHPLLRADEKAGLCSIDQTSGIAKYENGSLVILGGLEPSRIDSVLASEYATIFVTEGNENKFNDIENLFSRLNDTSVDENGKRIQLKFITDLNPTVKTNWTNLLFIRGVDPLTGELRANFHEFAALHFRVEDNEENLADGYIDSLKALSPAKRKRFYDGRFGAYEGLVYNIDEDVHIVDDFPVPAEWEKGMGIDFGYTHPFVCLWAAYDKSNETIYIYREYKAYKTTVKSNAKEIHNLNGYKYEEYIDSHGHAVPKVTLHKPGCAIEREEACDCGYVKIDWTVADHDAEDRATLHENLIQTVAANKAVDAGIDRVEELLEHDPEKGKKTNIKIFRSCVETINGFNLYRWKDPATARSNPKDREVVKEDDDEMDALRYIVMKFFPPGGKQTAGVVMGKKGIPKEHREKKEAQKAERKIQRVKKPKLPGPLKIKEG